MIQEVYDKYKHECFDCVVLNGVGGPKSCQTTKAEISKVIDIQILFVFGKRQMVMR